MRTADSVKFVYYASETRKLPKGTHPRLGLTATVHKILDHGSRIIHHHSLPIGMLSEEAHEARHEECPVLSVPAVLIHRERDIIWNCEI